MTDLETKIKALADAYYQGNEQTDDTEYDALIDRLRRENPNSALLPENQGIAGSDLKGVDKKYKLDITMGTLAKCNTDEQFKEWWSKHPHDYIVAESKIDGAGCYLHYENGEFKYARSRGDSEYGTDLTDKLLAVGIPTKLFNVLDGCVHYVEDGTIDIRGEVVMLRSVFDKYFKDQGFKNPRNTVSGVLGQKDTNKDILSKCTFIAYDLFDTSTDSKDIFHNDWYESKKLDFLKLNKFNVPEYKVNPSFEEVKAWKDSINTLKDEIPCDGVVIKQNKVSKEDLMRRTPLDNVAYKPNLQIAVTKVIGIDWTLKGRYMAPTAVVEPVELCGTTVQRASLSNINKMLELGIEIGSTVEIAKHGEIIPAIEKVIA